MYRKCTKYESVLLLKYFKLLNGFFKASLRVFARHRDTPQSSYVESFSPALYAFTKLLQEAHLSLLVIN